MEKSNSEPGYLAATVELYPLGATDEAFGTVIGPQQVAVRLLPGGTGRHTLHRDK